MRILICNSVKPFIRLRMTDYKHLIYARYKKVHNFGPSVVCSYEGSYSHIEFDNQIGYWKKCKKRIYCASEFWSSTNEAHTSAS